MERVGLLPTTKFDYRKGLDNCDALLGMSQTLQTALESEQKSPPFDRVNHQSILCKLCSVGICGSVSSILTQFTSNR